ncbi:lipoamide dehydrogenase [Plasmodium falciparum RAJ116]|uniref:Lipoamide dehydrogenase n=1 Tax=Plasmodium falciparum RAJ116 TaxID=580058 RepID=A0A0L0CV63_PLAFA|nr:lipoamide dehydrogenase [Plasmodium falciparum RAJ116]
MVIRQNIKHIVKLNVVTLIWLSYLFLLKPHGTLKNMMVCNAVLLPFNEKNKGINNFVYINPKNIILNKIKKDVIKLEKDNIILCQHNRKRDNYIKQQKRKEKNANNFTFMLKGSTQNIMNINEKEYDLAIIGCGVGGHAAAINAMERNLKVIIFAGDENCIGGTCVNVGCIPSKALLYATNKYRELKNLDKLYYYGIHSNIFQNNKKYRKLKINKLRFQNRLPN